MAIINPEAGNVNYNYSVKYRFGTFAEIRNFLMYNLHKPFVEVVKMNRIKELRQSNGWLQADLARKLNIGKNTVSRYETEQRQLDPETICALCEIFGCTADYLLGRSQVRSFDLTPDEAELLRGYRALSPEGREFIRHSMALAALGHGEKNRAASDLEAAT